jgi:hypothetical protein
LVLVHVVQVDDNEIYNHHLHLVDMPKYVHRQILIV